MTYTPGILTGTHRHTDGTPHTGTVTAYPNAPQVRDAADDVILTGAASVDLAGGDYSLSLPPSDDPSLNPAGVTYTVVVALDGQAPITYRLVAVIAGTSRDETDLPLVGVDGELLYHPPVLVPGPVGPTGPQGPRGFTGEQGVPGIQGVAGDVGPAGPKGTTGSTGAVGPVGPAGLTWRGSWSASVDYANNDSVGYDGSSWFAVGDPPLGHVPATGSAYWQAMALRGTAGATGPAGPTGAAGPAGPAGAQGVPGIQGVVGPVGATGPQGVAGPAGPTGTTGAVGPTGPQGAIGPQGAAGTPASLTVVTDSLASDANVAANATLNVFTLNLGVGVWLINYGLTFTAAGALSSDMTLTADTAVATFAGQPAAGVRFVSGLASGALTAVATVTTAGTILARFRPANTAVTIKSTGQATTLPTTGIVAVKVA